MGRIRHKRTHHARRDVSRGARTRARTLDLDQIQTTLRDASKLHAAQNPASLDVDKAGLGLFYCVHCDKNFPSADNKEAHERGKVHKRRVKKLENEEAYTVEESLRAAGIGTDNKQRKPKDKDQGMQSSE